MSETASNDLIFDVRGADFQQRVLDRSAQVPVVVDFWAAWCGPCRMLGPVLEKAVADKAGAVLLAKVDTDREPELAQRYRISGIPAVKAFRDGKLVDEFTGARDARFIHGFLDLLAPPKDVQALDLALRHLQQDAPAAAEAILRPLLLEVTADKADRVRLALAEAVLAQGPGRFAEVVTLLDQIGPRSTEAESADKVRQLLSFYQFPGQLPGQPAGEPGEALLRQRLAVDASDHEARYALAALLRQRGAIREALEELLTLVGKSRRFGDDAARKTLVLLFEQIGPQHELTQEYRRRLQVVL